MRISRLIILLLILGVVNTDAQNEGFGNVEVIFKSHDNCISDSDRTEIIELLDKNRKVLLQEGLLTEPDNRNSSPLFEWPVKGIYGLDYNNTWAISNFVDHDFNNDTVEDYECNEKTYDGHKGTDIYTWPFPWYLYENNLVNVIAAAPGIIVLKQDGNEDDHCACQGSWNALYIEHCDGSVAWYGHLKSGSLTNKGVGSSVETGEYLGVLASSGCSTGPHLHLEVYSSSTYTDANLIDPFMGPCNDQNSTSWWVDQIEYQDPTVNAIFTHNQIPDMGCPAANEDPHFDNIFLPGETFYVISYFKDQLASTSASSKIRRPDNTIWASWNLDFTQNYNSSYWYNSWAAPNGPFGTWQFETSYEGVVLTHEFQILENEPTTLNDGNIGINTTNPKSALHIHNGDLYIDNSENGLILKSKNGNCYRLEINHNGEIIQKLLTNCPE